MPAPKNTPTIKHTKINENFFTPKNSEMFLPKSFLHKLKTNKIKNKTKNAKQKAKGKNLPNIADMQEYIPPISETNVSNSGLKFTYLFKTLLPLCNKYI